MKVLVINGANLNLLGKREPEIYGSDSLSDIENYCKNFFVNLNQTWFHSNLEGDLVDEIQKAQTLYDGIIINPGGYSHTSVAIYDSYLISKIPIIEVHLSNPHKREFFRHTLLTAGGADGIIAGIGKESYYLALSYLDKILKDKKNEVTNN